MLVNQVCNHHRRLLAANAPNFTSTAVSPLWHTPTRDLSTLDEMWNKVISLPAVHYLEDTLAAVHDSTGIPWCGVLVGATAVLRLGLTFPAQITSQKVAAKRFLLYKEMNDEIIPALKRATDAQVRINHWNKEKAERGFKRVYKQVLTEKTVQYNCHVSKLFLPLYIQIPAWLCASIAVRNLSLMRSTPERMMEVNVEERYLQLATEGALWFPNLVQPDQIMILPVLVGATFAANVFMGAARMQIAGGKIEGFSKYLNYFLYSLAGAMVFVSAYQPSAVSLYWTTSGLMGMAVNLGLMSPSLRRFVRIPATPKDAKHPYRDLKEHFVNVIMRRK